MEALQMIRAHKGAGSPANDDARPRGMNLKSRLGFPQRRVENPAFQEQH
jgi:hypothetical protein